VKQGRRPEHVGQEGAARLPAVASKTAGSGRGPCRLARSRALSTGLSNAYFRSLGLPSLFAAC
jgi:RNA-directed DNA polymerase